LVEIAYIQPLTLIDYPGKLAAIVFTQGCNFNCRYCYNSQLIPILQGKIDKSSAATFFSSRSGQLEGVVITGGEPTIHRGLPELCSFLKELGYSVKLDTNGSNPSMLKMLIDRELVDYVAMDYKAPLEKYSLVAGVEVDTSNISESAEAIMSSGLQYELRTTVARELLTLDDIVSIAKEIKGAELYVIQSVRSPPDKNVKFTPYSSSELESIEGELLKYVKRVKMRYDR